ncbi:hypothetical protein SEA_BARNSTORMER_63 [Microbacterium phage Barnstormer]|uniref:Uncharacterized protein n=1 Tax=Microbacterium phage Barnstormer TaxID=3028491 RepID=A0AAE9ZKX2_9CAUD|nr:hypothetical protein SEA_BARNSTORMER_63 [Microbacterium phage Barnstormer]WDS52169.1 hypothetical protein SEA_UTZCHIPS_63 [Microbacterium phage UtzChips]
MSSPIVFPVARPAFPVLSLEEATTAMDAAYDRKGQAAARIAHLRNLMRDARAEFNDASRALARAEAAHEAAEARAARLQEADALLDDHLLASA